MTDLALAGHRLRASALKPAPQGVFEGYASVFNAIDVGGDQVLPGAFAKSLHRRGATNIRMLFQHDPGQPIGTWLDIKEDAKGLYVRGRLSMDVQRSSELAGLLRDGAIDGLSIGFKTIRARRDSKTGIRKLLTVDLWEISLVTFPMLASARIASLKAHPDLALPMPVVASADRQTRPRGLNANLAASDLSGRLHHKLQHRLRYGANILRDDAR